MFMVVKDATACLIVVFVIVFGQQWHAVAQRKKVYQASMHTQYTQYTAGFARFMGLLTIRRT